MRHGRSSQSDLHVVTAKKYLKRLRDNRLKHSKARTTSIQQELEVTDFKSAQESSERAGTGVLINSQGDN